MGPAGSPSSIAPAVSIYDQIDRDAIRVELVRFVDETHPVASSVSGSMFQRAACGGDRLIELQERVRPILDRLYPGWADEDLGSKYQETSEEREACQRLIARIDSHEEVASLLAPLDAGPSLAADALHELVWRAASVQWETDHREDAVLAAATTVNSLLQRKLGRTDLSETKLVQEAFSKKAPESGKPRLRFPEIEDDQTRESMRFGASSFGVGCFAAIRNPLGHVSHDQIQLTEQEALERLTAWSLFARWVEQATLVEAE
jgi:hypothetical protein